MEVVIDVQGFPCGSSFIFKEIAFESLDGKICRHYVFKPPFPFESLSHKDQRKARWLSKYYHGLDWECGRVEYTLVHGFLKKLFDSSVRTFVKGNDKIRWLMPYSKKTAIFELERDYLCPSLKKLNSVYSGCCYMRHQNCALQNVKKLNHYLKHCFDQFIE